MGRKNAWEKFDKSLVRGLMPIDPDALLGGPFKPFAEVMTNYDFLRDKRIIPAYEEGMRVEFRKLAQNSSAMGRVIADISNAIFDANWDPRFVDKTISGTLFTPGVWAMRTSDLAEGAITGDSGKTKRAVNGLINSVTGLFVDSPGSASQDVNYILDQARFNQIDVKDFYKFLQEKNSQLRTADTNAKIDTIKEDIRKKAAVVRKRVEEQVIRVNAELRKDK